VRHDVVEETAGLLPANEASFRKVKRKYWELGRRPLKGLLGGGFGCGGVGTPKRRSLRRIRRNQSREPLRTPNQNSRNDLSQVFFFSLLNKKRIKKNGPPGTSRPHLPTPV
jgi:hypothetical protein